MLFAWPAIGLVKRCRLCLALILFLTLMMWLAFVFHPMFPQWLPVLTPSLWPAFVAGWRCL